MLTLPRTLLALLLLFATGASLTVPSALAGADPAVVDGGTEDLEKAERDAPIQLDDDLEELRRRFEEEMTRMREEFRRELERVQRSDARQEVRAMRERLAELERENAELRRAMRRMRAGEGGATASDRPPAAADAPAAAGSRGQLGVRLGPTDPEVAAAIGVDPDQSFQVLGVQEGSAAARMRLRDGDVILEFDGRSGGVDAFIEHMTPKRAGDELVLTYARLQSGGDVLRITGRTQLQAWQEPPAGEEGGVVSMPAIRLTPMPPPPLEPPPRTGGGPVTFGVTVEESENGRGVIVTDVTPGGNAAAAALEVGDRIFLFAGEQVLRIERLAAVLGTVEGGQEVVVGFARGDRRWMSRVRLAGAGGTPERIEGPVPFQREGEAPAPPAPPSSAGPGFLGVVPEESDNVVSLAEVLAGGPAATMGLQAGDRLVNVAGRRIRSIDDLRDALSGMKAGESIRIVYRRDGARAVASGTLGTPPADDDQSSVPAPASPRPADGAGARPSLGVVAELVDGVVVLTGFSGGSPTAAAGARVGDAIARIAGSPVEGFETIIAALEAAAPGDLLPLTLLRDGRPIDLRVQLGVLPVVEEEPVVEIGEETSALSPLESTRRPYVGVEVEERGDGVWVVAVHGDSPARAAGLRGGDRILAIGSRDVIDLPSMRDAVLSLPHDAATGFTILREGRTTDLEVTPTPR